MITSKTKINVFFNFSLHSRSPLGILYSTKFQKMLILVLEANSAKMFSTWGQNRNNLTLCEPRLKVGNKWDWTSVGGNWKHILLHLLITCTCSHSTRISVSTFFSQFEIQEPIGHPYSLLTQRTTVTQHMSQLGFNRFNISLKLLFQIFFFGEASFRTTVSPMATTEFPNLRYVIL